MKKKNSSTAPTTEHATSQGYGFMNRSFARKTNIFLLGGTNSKSVTIFSTAGAIFLTTVVIFLTTDVIFFTGGVIFLTTDAIFLTGVAIFLTADGIFLTGVVIFLTADAIFSTAGVIFFTAIAIFLTGVAIFSWQKPINSKLDAVAAGTDPYEMPVFGYRQMAA